MLIWYSESGCPYMNYDIADIIQEIASIIVYKYVVLMTTPQNGYFWMKMMNL